jgi:hypothetical protein
VTPIERNRILARMFTRPVMAALARTGRALPALSFLSSTGVAAARGNGSTVGQLFERAFEDVNRQYRNEYVYKTAIANRIVFGRHRPQTAAMQVELSVGRSIVDVAVFNGTSTAYEIKTELDTAKRLESQSADYLRAFDRVYLVTHPQFINRFKDALDERVGILALTRDDSLRVVRAAQSNIDSVDPRMVLRMLRRDEYVSAVERVYGPQPRLANGLIFAHFEKRFGQLSSDQAHQAFVAAMRARTTEPSFAEFVSALPKSLRALGFATPLSRVQRQRVLSAIASNCPLRIV